MSIGQRLSLPDMAHAWNAGACLPLFMRMGLTITGFLPMLRPHTHKEEASAEIVVQLRQDPAGGLLAARLLPAERAALDNLKGTRCGIVDRSDD